MFAFAIWDATRQRLFAARDRFGEKPFYYLSQSGSQGSSVTFASELRALRASGLGGGAIDRRALRLPELLYIPAPRTIYDDVQKLPAGHSLSADRAECGYSPTGRHPFQERAAFAPRSSRAPAGRAASGGAPAAAQRCAHRGAALGGARFVGGGGLDGPGARARGEDVLGGLRSIRSMSSLCAAGRGTLFDRTTTRSS